MRVEVTQDHINKGKRVDCLECPIALALSEKFPDKDVYVLTYTCYVGSKMYRLPFEVTKFITNFDTYSGNIVEPFSFEI